VDDDPVDVPGGAEADDEAAPAAEDVSAVPPVAGAGVVEDAAGSDGLETGGGVGSLSEVPTDRSFDRMASPNDVNMKTTAQPAVNLARKVVAPRPPKIVWLEPPNVAPISAPLPDWRRIAPTMTNAVNR
jgi:hypothetical protein